VYPGLAIALLGAIPTAIQGIRALQLGIPFGEVPFATKSKNLFATNFDCLKKTGPAVKLKNNTEVQAVICDSGDIWIRVTTANNRTEIRWIRPTDIVGESSSARIGVNEALAASQLVFAPPDFSVEAQCVYRDASGHIIRLVKVETGRCQAQQVNPYTGSVTVVAQDVDCSCPR
jgi:hypothetical protein